MVENQTAGKAGTPKLGIEHLKKAAFVGVGLLMGGLGLLKSHTLGDIMAMIPTLMKIPELAKDKAVIGAEWKDRDSAELAELDAYIKAEFKIPDAKREKVIEGGLTIVVAILNEIDLIGDLNEA